MPGFKGIAIEKGGSSRNQMHFEVTVYAYVYIFMGMMIDASGD